MIKKTLTPHANTKGNVIELVLTEYTVLKTEIQNRSLIQNTILGVHITSITFILGAILAKSSGQWVNFLIPLEASLFGLWWTDHALVIAEIGTYIRKFIEPRLSKMVKQEKIMAWETTYIKGILLPDIKRTVTFTRLIFITFGIPSIISIMFSFAVIIINIIKQSSLLPSEITLPIEIFYPGLSIWIAATFLIINIVLFSIYNSMYRYYLKIINEISNH